MELVAPSHLCIILIGEAVINIKLTLGDKGDMIMKQKDYYKNTLLANLQLHHDM